MCPVCAATIAQLVVAATSAIGGATALIVKTIWKTTHVAALNGSTASDGGVK